MREHFFFLLTHQLCCNHDCCQLWSGNRRYRQQVELHRPEFRQHNATDQARIALDVVRTVQREGGRFLQAIETPASPTELAQGIVRTTVWTVLPETDDYTLQVPVGFPMPDIPADNALTKSRVELGHRLFYDPALSADSTRSCGSCHAAYLAFSDSTAVSMGIENRAGTRLCGDCLRVTIGTPQEDNSLLGALRSYKPETIK